MDISESPTRNHRRVNLNYGIYGFLILIMILLIIQLTFTVMNNQVLKRSPADEQLPDMKSGRRDFPFNNNLEEIESTTMLCNTMIYHMSHFLLCPKKGFNTSVLRKVNSCNMLVIGVTIIEKLVINNYTILIFHKDFTSLLGSFPSALMILTDILYFRKILNESSLHSHDPLSPLGNRLLSDLPMLLSFGFLGADKHKISARHQIVATRGCKLCPFNIHPLINVKLMFIGTSYNIRLHMLPEEMSNAATIDWLTAKIEYQKAKLVFSQSEQERKKIKKTIEKLRYVLRSFVDEENLSFRTVAALEKWTNSDF
nr:ORF11 [Bracoviriform inaniti]